MLGPEWIHAMKPGRTVTFSSCSFVFATSKVNKRLESSSSVVISSDSSFQTMPLACSDEIKAITWPAILVR